MICSFILTPNALKYQTTKAAFYWICNEKKILNWFNISSKLDITAYKLDIKH